MKASAALREGVRLDGEQVRGEYFKFDGDKIVGCCALGAMALAVGWKIDDSVAIDRSVDFSIKQNIQDLDSILDEANKPEVLTKKLSYRLSSAVISLNDIHGWTREQIADWLESIGH